MSKKIRWLVIGVIALAVVAAIAVWGRNYYQDRYVGSDYYAMVPLDFDATPGPIYSDSGAEEGMGKNYQLTAYNEQGEARLAEFAVHVPGSGYGDAAELPQPGDYLRISLSKQLVVYWTYTTRSEVPASVLALIDRG